MIIGNIGSGATFIGATIIQAKFAKGTGTKGDGYAFVAMTWIFNIFFSACIGPLSWAYPVEIMNTAIRAKATALTSMSCWIASKSAVEQIRLVVSLIALTLHLQTL